VALAAAQEAPTVSVTLDDVGASAWVVVSAEGTEGAADPGEENAELELREGTRYRFVNWDGRSHPLEFRDDDGAVLLSQEGGGSSEGDEVRFTLTSGLADVLESYHCSRHSGMVSEIEGDGADDGTDDRADG